MSPRWDLDSRYGGPRRLPLRAPRRPGAKQAGPSSSGPWPELRDRDRPPLGLVWRSAGWVLLGLALGAVVAAGAGRLRSRAAPVELVSWGTVEESFPVQALVIRREEVEVAPISGRLLRLVGEDVRVAAGQAVVEVVNPEARVSLESWAAGVKEAWEHFQKEDEGKRQAALKKVAALQDELATAMADLREASAAADRATTDRAWSRIDQISSRLATAQRALGKLDKERAELLSRQARVATLSREAVVRLAAPESGLVSYRVDGLEPALRPDRMLETDPLLAQSPPPLLPAAGDQVQAGQPLFKVVDPEYGVLAFRLPEPQAQLLGRRDLVRLTRPDRVGADLAGRVQSVGPREPDGYRAVYVRLQSLLEGDLTLARAVSLAVVIRTEQGTLVPAGAVCPDPGSPVPEETSPGVWLEEGGEARWRPVTVQANDGRWAVVGGVKAGAVLATTGWERKIR